MNTYTTEQIQTILTDHTAWLRGEPGGTHADLAGADLRRANLAGADLRRAVLPDSIPVVPNIDAEILAAVATANAALDMLSWHLCETTHCRAGWAVHLAGDAGKALESKIGPSAAGALIYAASGSHPVPDWHTSNAEAMADMRARVGL